MAQTIHYLWFLAGLCSGLLTVLIWSNDSFGNSHNSRKFTFEYDKISDSKWPIIINTWAFDEANQAGWEVLTKNESALSAIVVACSKCQTLQCDHTVGWGGSPDENGETTLDAMIMDGFTHKVASIGALRDVKNVIGVAKALLEHSSHTMLVGDQATEFAIQMGFQRENISSKWSIDQYEQWRRNNCQPNYWFNVRPDPLYNCGPYSPVRNAKFAHFERSRDNWVDATNHDTIGVVAIDKNGHLGSGTSTNGMRHKIPGRVGDSPIPGAGSYADQDVGGAASTGDGDIILRFLPSYQAVENIRNGMKPEHAAQNALLRIQKKYPKAQIGLIALDKDGNFGASCMNVEGGFPFVVRYRSPNDSKSESVRRVNCI
ncbi:Asparaginase-like protein [Sarcoptes scabiei]|nr:Asparaginase-like protein [Sarcoptes scabiei]